MLKDFISFYERRIKIPVDNKALVLDIGSGDKPHWRSDVLLDKYIDKKFGSQRSGSAKTVLDRPMFISDVSNMPFKDKAFDFVICSHLLEHVVDPASTINEIVRVGKAGYIELPYEGTSKLIDFPTHLWYCNKVGKKLIFKAKKQIYFDKEIDKLMGSRMGKEIKKIIKNNFDSSIIKLKWKDKIEYEVIGMAKEELSRFEDKKVKYNKLVFSVRNIINFFFSSLLFFKKRSLPIFERDILKKDLVSNANSLVERKKYCFNK